MIALVGATGFTGALCAAELARRGLPAVWIARSRERLDALAGRLGAPADLRVATPDAPDGLAAALDGCAVVLNTVGPFVTYGAPVLSAALARRAHYVDTTGEQTWLLSARERDAEAQAAGVAAIPAAAYEFALGECAAALAVDALGGGPADVDAYYLGISGTSHGTAKSALGILAAGGVCRRGEALVREPLAVDTVAMPGFDRPRTVVAIPGNEALQLPRHRDVRDVRTWMGLSPRLARLARLGPALRVLGFGPVRRLAERRIEATPEPTPEERARAAFVVAARARRDGREAWCRVEGNDPYGITAALTVEAAARLVAGPPSRTGVISAPMAFPPRDLLASVGLTPA